MSRSSAGSTGNTKHSMRSAGASPGGRAYQGSSWRTANTPRWRVARPAGACTSGTTRPVGDEHLDLEPRLGEALLLLGADAVSIWTSKASLGMPVAAAWVATSSTRSRSWVRGRDHARTRLSRTGSPPVQVGVDLLLRPAGDRLGLSYAPLTRRMAGPSGSTLDLPSPCAAGRPGGTRRRWGATLGGAVQVQRPVDVGAVLHVDPQVRAWASARPPRVFMCPRQTVSSMSSPSWIGLHRLPSTSASLILRSLEVVVHDGLAPAGSVIASPSFCTGSGCPDLEVHRGAEGVRDLRAGH